MASDPDDITIGENISSKLVQDAARVKGGVILLTYKTTELF